MSLPMRSAGLSAVPAGAPSSAGSLREVRADVPPPRGRRESPDPRSGRCGFVAPASSSEVDELHAGSEGKSIAAHNARYALETRLFDEAPARQRHGTGLEQ